MDRKLCRPHPSGLWLQSMGMPAINNIVTLRVSFKSETSYTGYRSPAAVYGFAMDAKGSRIEAQQGRLLRFDQLSISTILNLIGAEVLIKIRISYLPLLM